jgi:GNAT superfamily N-acetyltransferase
MENNYTIKLETNPQRDDVQVLGTGIMQYAIEKRGQEPIEFFALFIRDENNVIRGGCSFCNLYGCLHVDNLWLEEALRGKGYGTQLMLEAEKKAKERGCTFAAVNTMDWEALGFYKKLGYTIELERSGFLKDSIFYFLRKELANNSNPGLDLLSLQANHIPEIVSSFKNIGWNKPSSLYEFYLTEQNQNQRSVIVAKMNEQFCGYVTLKWKSDYEHFMNKDIPEIADLNVLPNYRKKGVGTALIQKCEIVAKEHGYSQIGLGVGMTRDYGNAQRLYFDLGYAPDGNGLYHHYKAVNYSDRVKVDDDLVLFLNKNI